MCKIIFYIFCILYAAAIFLWLVGRFGWFGAEQDPLSGVFLIILGQPWTRWVDKLPETLWPIASAFAPAINGVILFGICRFLGRGAGNT